MSVCDSVFEHHLADAFIQSNLQCIQSTYTFLSVHAFPEVTTTFGFALVVELQERDIVYLKLQFKTVVSYV